MSCAGQGCSLRFTALFGRFKVDDSGMSLDTEPSRHLGEEEQETQR